MKRRNFIRTSALGATAIGLQPWKSFSMSHNSPFISNRPLPGERAFTSNAVEQAITRIKAGIADPEVAWMFENCYPNTLDTTVTHKTINGRPDTFIITGDIHAMWLRDSTAQVWPYLPLVNDDQALKTLFIGLINRQSDSIIFDPYANAFNDGPIGSYWETDLTEMKPELHERKWEIDSLCYPVRLAYHYWKKTNDASIFDDNWKKAAKLIIQTFREQQRKDGKGPYSFMRVTEKATDTMPGKGFGNPIKPNGLICSGFRPSDDATTYLFLIPSNYFAVTSLRQMAEIFTAVYSDSALADESTALANEVDSALKEFARVTHPKMGEVLPYEVDGFGNVLYMDDANVPSLLSLPYLGCIDKEDPLYRRTRRLLLSHYNPWYSEGTAAKGIGGPHIGEDMIWPMSIIMRALTSDDEAEIIQCITWLKNTHAGTGFMHETFHKDDPSNFTRSWFAWANTLFGELIMTVHDKRPHILKQIF
jgi:meiotically up-regulated gene 157 (Mug157) protein